MIGKIGKIDFKMAIQDIEEIELEGINPVRNSSRCDSKPSGALFLTG
jgi:hypothetical protein